MHGPGGGTSALSKIYRGVKPKINIYIEHRSSYSHSVFTFKFSLYPLFKILVFIGRQLLDDPKQVVPMF